MNPARDGDLQHPVLVDTPRTIDIASIESELTALWKLAEDVEGTDSHQAVIRACSLNLVVWTDDEREASAADRLLEDISIVRPSRIFLIIAKVNQTNPSLEAWVSARCAVPLPGEKQVCCEQINLTAGRTEVQKVSSIVTSLLVADVPFMVLWKAPLEHEPQSIFSLFNIADRIIVDTSTGINASSHFASLAWLMRDGNIGPGISDLAWGRLNAWRRVLADAMEIPSTRADILQGREIAISYTVTGSSSGLGQAMLLLGWLTYSFEWRILRTLRGNDQGGYQAEFRSGDSIIIARIIREEAAPEGPGEVHGMRIETGDKRSLNIELSRESSCVRMKRPPGSEITRGEVFPVKRWGEAEILLGELDAQGTDPFYRMAVETIVRMFGEHA